MDLKTENLEDIISLDTQDILNLRHTISKMNKSDQIEVFKLLKKKKVKYTENKNGIFINLTKLSNKILLELQNFVDFSIQNKNTLEKENIIRDSFRDKFDKDNTSNSTEIENNNFQEPSVTITTEEIIDKNEYVLFEDNLTYSLSENQKQLCGLSGT